MSYSQSSNTHLVFLHGWGQSSQIWCKNTDATTQQFIHHLHLPGHGGHHDISHQHWLSHLEQCICDISNGNNIILIGWSLGGQLVLALEEKLRGKSIIQGLVLIATTPCFRQKKDWLQGCDQHVWQDFRDASTTQDPKFLRRFFQRMIHGDILTRQERNLIAKQAIDQKNPPSFAGLEAGLQLLCALDWRQQLLNIKIPVLIIHGQQDVIVPVHAAKFLSENIKKSELNIFQDCGHVPFLTHHVEFNRLLEQWWKKLSM